MPPILKNSFEKMIISISDYYIASMKKGGWVSSNISSRVSSIFEFQVWHPNYQKQILTSLFSLLNWGTPSTLLSKNMCHILKAQLMRMVWVTYICTLCLICIRSFAFLWCKMPMFRRAGIREGGKPTPLAFQYLIFMV